MRVFGIDPGSVRTGYGCIETDGRRHRLVSCGAITCAPGAALADRLQEIHARLRELMTRARPDCVAIENLFHAKNVKSALVLGHARGVAVLAAVQAGVPIVEYTPAAIKASVVGYGRADKGQMQQMVKLLLGLDAAPSPHDAADALAVAICHVHTCGPVADVAAAASRAPRHLRSWRHVKIAQLARRQVPVIAHLSGLLREKQLQRLIVDVGGVGYDVTVPLSTTYALGEAGSAVNLRIHTHVREDALQLFGFATALEQTLFERLISVSGIGPKVALAILSGIEPAELTRAIRSSDVVRLTRIPGVGKKTAERVVLELKDRLPQPATAELASAPGQDDVRANLLSALANLGYNPVSVDKTVDKVLGTTENRSFEILLRATLKLLVGR